jgi:hypothetical protein
MAKQKLAPLEVFDAPIVQTTIRFIYAVIPSA